MEQREWIEWPRCEACGEALPRSVAEKRGLVKPINPPADATCKKYVLEKQYNVKRKFGKFL